MLTYVINTSENKTFDSDLLFELAGYNKIRWMHCSLNQVEECAKEIYTKQNILGADVFRIAVLIDFYCFDKIRKPYGNNGYRTDPGVDLCIYYPYIKAYLADHLFDYLEKRDLHSQACEIYYIQNEKSDRFHHLANVNEQLKKIIQPSGEPVIKSVKQYVEPSDQNEEPGFVEQETETYSAFSLYCTPSVSLVFGVDEYPYCDGTSMTFDQFIHEFYSRVTENDGIYCHTYVTAYGGGSALAAFDVLALSLYLIRMYEREEIREKDWDFDIERPDPLVLKEVLEKAWNKIRIAQRLSKESTFDYYSLDLESDLPMEDEEKKEKSEEELLREYRAKIDSSELNMSAEDMYRRIMEYESLNNSGKFSKEDRKEFDDIILKYLQARDDTCEENVKKEFDRSVQNGVLKTVKQCPSQVQYDMVVKSRQEAISRLFHRALSAEYIKTDYSEVQKKARTIYGEYLNLKARASKVIWADIIGLFIMVISMLVPYHVLQGANASGIALFFRYEIAASVFVGIYLLIFALITIPLSIKLKRTKNELRRCLETCMAKHKYAFPALKQRYEVDLHTIEQSRYEIRRIAKLHESNITKNQSVNRHRKILEMVENRLSAILNNLGVEPALALDEDLEDEFDIQKPIHSSENRIYRVFSIEVIESMFPKKGGSI